MSAPRAYRKDVSLVFGQVIIPVNITNAVIRDESLSNICCGDSNKPHDAAGIRNNPACPVCGNQDATTWRKGRKERDGSYVPVDVTEVKQLQEEAVAGTKDMLTIGWHPANDVLTKTAPGKGCYQLTPSKEGLRSFFDGVVDAIERHPELAFMTLWSPTTRSNQYQLTVQSGALVMVERVRAENLNLTPQPATSVGQSDRDMLDQFVIAPKVSAFDPTTYADSFKAKLEALIAARQSTPGAVLPSAPSAPAATVDLSSLLASLATSGATP